jgi:hypothetical protein
MKSLAAKATLQRCFVTFLLDLSVLVAFGFLAKPICFVFNQILETVDSHASRNQFFRKRRDQS